MKNKLLIPLSLIILVIIFRIYNTSGITAVTNYDYMILRAKELRAAGDTEPAEELLLNAIKNQPQDPEAYIILGLIYTDENKFPEAEKIFSDVLTNHSNNEEALLSLMNIYLRLGSYDELNKLLADNRSHPILLKNKPVPPICDKECGEYQNRINLTFKSTDNGKILYTIDGTLPDYDSAEYNSPIELGKGAHSVKAVTVLDGLKSDIVELDYFILNDYAALEFLNSDMEMACRNFLDTGADILTDTDSIETILIMGSNIYFNVSGMELVMKKDFLDYTVESVCFNCCGQPQEFIYFPAGDVGGLVDLANFKSLREVYIFGQTEVDLSFAEYLTNLEKLSLANNSNLSNLNSLDKIENLTSLELMNNGTYAFHVLPSLAGLQSLNLSCNGLDNIDFVSELTELTSLNLNNNKLSDVEPVSGLPNLKTLHIKNNKIANTDALDALGLEYLEK